MLNDIGKQAYGALLHNRRRSLLTMLGMAWGIATVVLLLAYGSGFERGLMAAFTTFGGNLIAIAQVVLCLRITPNQHQPFRIFIRQRFQKHRIHDTEHRSVGTDAQRD